MWIETALGLINLDYAEKITVDRNFVYFFKSDPTGKASQTTLGVLELKSADDAKAVFRKLKDQIETLDVTPD